MITDKDIAKLKSVFATKADLEGFATKDDLKGFATKDDLDKSEIRTAKSFEDIQSQVSELKHEITDIKHNMLTMEDNILGAINKLQVENSITASYRPRIENHEQRITKLEKLQFAN